MHYCCFALLFSGFLSYEDVKKNEIQKSIL